LIIIGFSPHRVEALPFILESMDRLGFEECRSIYSRIRFKPRDQALEVVIAFVSRKDKTE
jgi:hypothetical protein